MKKTNTSKSGKKLRRQNQKRQEAIDRIHRNIINYTGEIDVITKNKKLKQEEKDDKIVVINGKINKAKKVIEFTEKNLYHKNQY